MTTDTAQFERWFTASEDAANKAQIEATRARDYFDGNQLSSEEIAFLKARGQPPVIVNRIRRKIEWLKGLEVKQRTDPKAFPRTPEHADDAEAVTEALRYVCDNVDWDMHRTCAYENMLIEGFGGVEVVHKNTRRGVEVQVNHYPWDRLWYDPHSRRDDFSDARYKGIVVWMDEADFKAKYPKADVAYDNLFSEVSSSVHDDKPEFVWLDVERKRIRVFLVWYRDGGEWKWCEFVKGAKLDGGDSPYKDEDGASVCPLVMQSAYVGRDNDRYGIVRDMFDPQDEVNKRRSKLLHQLNSRQTIGVKGAVKSVAEMKRELARPDGHVELNVEAFMDAMAAGVKPFEVVSQNDQVAGQFSLLQESKQEIDLMGANSALEGETGESASGRAVLARQQGGMIEIAALLDKLHRFTREVYRHMWMRIQQFWTEQRWIRVTDDEANVRFVSLNQPVTLGEALSQMDPAQVEMVALQYGLGPGDSRLDAVVAMRNNLAELDVDIILEEVPDRVTLAGEVFEALLKYGPAIPPAVLIEADPTLPQKKKEALLEGLSQPQNPSPKEQMEMLQGEAEAAKTMAEAEKIQVETAYAGVM